MIARSPLPSVAVPEVALPAFVLRHAARLSGKPAIVDGITGASYTYGELAGAVDRVAAGLAARGFGKGDVLAMYTPNLPEYPIAFLAVATLGGAVTTVNPLYTPDELVYQLNDSRARLLVTVPAFLDKAVAARPRSGVDEIFVLGDDTPTASGTSSFRELLEADGSATPPPVDVHRDVVALPYSSGTTGLAKGVMLTHHNLVANLCQWEPVGMVTEQDTTIGVLPFFHIYGLSVILGLSLASGATVVSLPRFEFATFLRTLQDRRVTVGFAVPPIMLALAQQPIVDDYDLSALNVIASAAAPLGRDLQETVAKRLGCAVVQAWGMTETSPLATCDPLDPARQRPGSVGVCVSDTECKVIDVVTGDEAGFGQQGEVCVRGPQVMRGYLNNPQATSQMLEADGWLHTGDIGFLDEDGYLYIVDRLKELIKYKGMQVAPAELEALLVTHPAVADAAVIPSDDAEAGEVPKAFVVLRSGSEATAEELMGYVAERLAPHKRIRRLEFVGQVPRSASGKILRRVLIEQDRGQASA